MDTPKQPPNDSAQSPGPDFEHLPSAGKSLDEVIRALPDVRQERVLKRAEELAVELRTKAR